MIEKFSIIGLWDERNYRISFKDGSLILRHDLIEQIGLSRDEYWGFFELSDDEFINIVKQGQATDYIQ